MYSSFESKVIYQLMLRVFTPEGTLAAAKEKLPFLQELGVDYIYLCPCFLEDDDGDRSHWSKRQRECGCENPKNPYRIKDYYTIDPEYGTMEDLARFIQTAHHLGMRVLLDLVYMHCGPTAVFLKEHPDFVRCLPDGTPDYGEYNFPMLDFENPRVRAYFWENMEWYVRELDVDGYRCDVGDSVPVDFWEEGVRRIKAIKPDIFMLDEGNNPQWVERAFDACYLLFWPCHEGVKRVFHGEKPASLLREIEAVLDTPRGKAKIRALETHDTVSDEKNGRYEEYAGTAATEAALVYQFCMDGIPFLYNGYEIGDRSHHTLFSNRFNADHQTIDWSLVQTEAGRYRFALVQRLCQLRHTVPALSEGNLTWKYGLSEQMMAFTRRAPGSRVAAAFNTGDGPQTITLVAHRYTPLLSAGVQERVLENGCLELQLESKGYYLASFED